MIIKRFSSENFRNIERCDIEFSPGINILYGKNAQGKTNAIEGIYLFSRGKSFRASEDKELIRFGTEGFRISIEYEDKDGKGSLEYALFGRERRRKKNGYKISKVTEMLGSFRSVLFYPDNLGLVKDGPEERRAFLNIAASQCYPAYMKIYADYKSALENRNTLLKLASKGFYISEEELDCWSYTMSEYAADIYLMRLRYIDMLKVHAGRIMKDISSGEEELTLYYKRSIDDTVFNLSAEEKEKRENIINLYYSKFTGNKEKEKAAGVSLYGPHRDDIEIEINGKSARLFASQGQQRSTVLALKLAEGEVNREVWGEYPVYLFDDVLSELDEKRREYVLSGAGERQIIITTCEKDKISFATGNIIEVTGGEYVSSRG